MGFWVITFESFEGPSASCGASQLCCKKLPRWGLTLRLRRGGGTWRMVFFARRNRRGAGGNGGKYQPSGLSAEGGNDPEFRQTTSGAHGSAGRADCLPRGKPPACDIDGQFCRKKFPPGLDAPTPARMVGLPPRRGKYFLSARKKVPKKARGTATTGKSPLLPILPAGLAMSRAIKLDS